MTTGKTKGHTMKQVQNSESQTVKLTDEQIRSINSDLSTADLENTEVSPSVEATGFYYNLAKLKVRFQIVGLKTKYRFQVFGLKAKYRFRKGVLQTRAVMLKTQLRLLHTLAAPLKWCIGIITIGFGMAPMVVTTMLILL